jgi:HSP20 family protein
LGLSQERFAQLLGVSMQSVRRWEGGISRPLPVIATKMEDLARDLATAQQPHGGRPMGGSEQSGEQSSEQASEQSSEHGSERDSEQDRRQKAFGFGGMLKGIGNLVDLVSRMAEEGQDEVSRAGTFKTQASDAKGVYGFSVRLGLGGNPVVEEFGNLRETPSGPTVSDSREPLVDVLDEGDAVVVIAEMPGVAESDIRTEVQGEILRITAVTGRRKYRKDVVLSAPVDPGSVSTSYRNGVLEVTLAKRRDPGASDG